MSKNVFANGKEISAKKDDNKSICAMPDVCLSPPSPPAGPVPVPYPNTAQGSDTSDGSKTVKIGGDEAGLKDSSNYKKSSGDEAATKSLGMGVVTHTIQDKMKHAAWSMDVKFEGENVIRHMDMTTHNHMNTQNAGSMTVNQAKEKTTTVGDLSCKELEEASEDMLLNELKFNRLPEGFATTVSIYKPATGPPKFMQAVSCDAARPKKGKDGYQNVVKEKKMPPCAGERPTGSGRRHDSENKTLDPLMRAKTGGSIKMNTFHMSSSKMPDAMPCYSCRQAICEAEKCGISVTLCTSDDPPKEVEAKDLCKDGKPKGGTDDYDPLWASKGLG
ncbi:MAG TPA: DUF4150 domain-containing protein [Verrucomicrobiae bacterium]